MLSVIVLGKTAIESRGSDPVPAVAAVTATVAVALIAPGMLAVIVAVPVVVGVKTPVLFTEPMLEGLRDQVTALLKLPVPFTVAVQAEV